MATRTKPEAAEAASNSMETASNVSTSKHTSYVELASRISTAYPVGMAHIESEVLPNAEWTHITPGLMVLDFIPTFGISTTLGSALNRASYNVFNVIRSQISGNRPYEPADMQIEQCAVMSLRTLFKYVERIYKICNTYSALNLYKPKAILTAMGLDANDWMSRSAEVYNWMLTHAGAMDVFPLAKVGEIQDRQELYNEAIYKDGDIDAAQIYIINQKAFWSYEYVDKAKGLSAEAFPPTFDLFKDMWDRMYNALANSSDVYLISADIRRAFGDNVHPGLTVCPAGSIIEYVEFDGVKRSIMNAAIIPIDNSVMTNQQFYDEFRISDSVTDGLYCNPDLRYFMGDTFNENTSLKMLPLKTSHINAQHQAPDTSEVCDLVRFKPNMRWTEIGVVPDTNGIKEVSLQFTTFGTEIIIGGRIVVQGSNGYTDTQEIASAIALTYASNNGTPVSRLYAVEDYMRTVARLANFDWHPPVVGVMFELSSSVPEVIAYNEDIQNYIPISDQQLDQIHEAVILEQFGFPG